jgi:hypothetical protein
MDGIWNAVRMGEPSPRLDASGGRVPHSSQFYRDGGEIESLDPSKSQQIRRVSHSCATRMGGI